MNEDTKVPPVAQTSGDLSRVGRNMEGIEQPYAGAITLLETIAEAGCIAFYDDGSPTANRDLCLRFANDLRNVTSHPSNAATAEQAISAAMAEGNKHGVKSSVAARIISAYLAEETYPAVTVPQVAQMSGDITLKDAQIALRCLQKDDRISGSYHLATINAFLASHPSNAVQDAPIDWAKINKAALEFADAYRYDDGCVEVVPNKRERTLIDDCVASLLNDDDIRALFVTPAATVPQVAQSVPYAQEYGKSNGDGSYSVVIEKLPIPTYVRQVPDWPVKLLYAAPQPVATSPSIVPIPNSQIYDLAHDHTVLTNGGWHFQDGEKLIEFTRKVLALTTASNAGEAAQGEK